MKCGWCGDICESFHGMRIEPTFLPPAHLINKKWVTCPRGWTAPRFPTEAEKQQLLAARLHLMAMTTPRRDAEPFCNHFDTPYDAFRFVGNGPFYEFRVYEWTGVSAAAALNYFLQIGAIVKQHERHSDTLDGRLDSYEYFLVEWREKDVTTET